MNVTQRQLQAFLMVARLRHITRAAERLHISQAGLSAMLKDLERQLDCRLFDRTTRSVSITEAGERLIPAAARCILELQQAKEAIHNVSSRARSLLTVGTTPIIAASVMPEVIRAFMQKHPEVSLRVLDISREVIHERVAAGSLDVGFGAFFRPASGLERRCIAEFQLVCVCPRNRRARKGSPNQAWRWGDLDPKLLLSLPRNNPIQMLIDEQMHERGWGEGTRPEFENIQTMLAMVEAGAGIAILPSFIGPAARRHALSIHPLIEPDVKVSYFQISRKGRQLPPETLSVANALSDALNQGLYTPCTVGRETS